MNNRRDTYLREMEARLRHLPEVDRAEEMAEITQHFDSLIAACQADGKSPSDATEEAIARFGVAHDIGGRLYQADKHKRFVPLIEIGLFCAAFSALLNIAEQAFWHLLQASAYTLALRGTVPEAAAHNFLQIIQPRMVLWSLGWSAYVPISIGFASLAVLAVRYGARPALEKARQSPGVNAGLRWLVCVYLFGFLNPLHFYRMFGGTPTHPLEGVALFGSVLIGNFIPLLFVGLSAFFVGKTNQGRESMADAVGSAAFVGAATGLLQLLFQFVPTPWGSTLPTPFTDNLTGYLLSFSIGIVYGIVRVSVAYFCAQLGGKSRLAPLLA